MEKKDLLSRLGNGEVILGDGSYVVTLEKRGYVKPGDWTPDAAPEHPKAVEQLAVEFARAGADITQTFTFWCHDNKLPKNCKFTCEQINTAACQIAKQVSKEYKTITAGGITFTGLYTGPESRELVRRELTGAVEVMVKNDIDVILCEYFRNIEEMEVAIEVALETGKPVGACMAIGPKGDENYVSVQECAIRMAKAGAHLVGVNCLFDPNILLEVMADMKQALQRSNLNPYLMVQPLGFMCPDGGNFGWIDIPEFPLACEPRQITRWDAKKFARRAHQLGIQYIGGCCGFEAYHIRAMAEELRDVRGSLPLASDRSLYEDAHFQQMSGYSKAYTAKTSENWWKELSPCTGRPLSMAFSRQQKPVALPEAIFKT